MSCDRGTILLTSPKRRKERKEKRENEIKWIVRLAAVSWIVSFCCWGGWVACFYWLSGTVLLRIKEAWVGNAHVTLRCAWTEWAEQKPRTKKWSTRPSWSTVHHTQRWTSMSTRFRIWLGMDAVLLGMIINYRVQSIAFCDVMKWPRAEAYSWPCRAQSTYRVRRTLYSVNGFSLYLGCAQDLPIAGNKLQRSVCWFNR